MPYVLFIDGKMYGYHLGTDWLTAKELTEEKAEFNEGAVMELWLGVDRLVATFFDGRWA